MSKRWKERWPVRAILLLWTLLVLGVWPVRVSAQNVSAQEIGRDVKFYAGPYQQPPVAAIRRSVSAVEVNVVVRDAKGHAVGGLRQQDFLLYDNGKPQGITQFIVERATPLAVSTRPEAVRGAHAKGSELAAAPTASAGRSIAVFFDDRASSFRDLHYAQVAAEEFVRNDMQPGEEVGIFTALGTETQDYTADTGKLLAAIRAVRPEPSPAPPAALWRRIPEEFSFTTTAISRWVCAKPRPGPKFPIA
jgi:VWFA-related protein